MCALALKNVVFYHFVAGIPFTVSEMSAKQMAFQQILEFFGKHCKIKLYLRAELQSAFLCKLFASFHSLYVIDICTASYFAIFYLHLIELLI